MVFVTKTLPVSPFLATKFAYKSCHRKRATTLGGQSLVVLSSDSVQVNDIFSVDENNFGPLIDVGNGRPGKRVIERKKRGNESDYEKLDVFWDDGYGSKSVKDYLDYAKELIKPDGGPPRWFSPVECGCPLKGSPILLFLPGMDSLGWGLVLHHKALGKVFEVRCLHIPVHDRTSFEDLVKFVGESVKIEHKMSPSKPIYLVGDSFGGCLALSVAAKNPTIDLVLVLANPATSFCRSQLQPLFPLFEALPDELHMTVPYLLSIIMGDPLKMALVDVDRTLPPAAVLQQLSERLTALIPRLSVLADIIPKESLLWKLKLLKTASSYANSRLHAVTAEVVVLASGKDNMLPSVDEARRLFKTLKNCEVRNFLSNGHTILFLLNVEQDKLQIEARLKKYDFGVHLEPKMQEDGVNLLTVIKGTSKYRRSKRYDFVDDFLPPSMSECKKEIHDYRLYFYATSPVIFSTKENGTIVRGLSGVPSEGPVLLVGYHMLLGFEIGPLLEEFIRERNVMVRGMAHPGLFIGQLEAQSRETFFVDRLKLFGAVPVSPNNLYKLLSTKSFILLYPGGAREALHRKGEAYKLFWPDEPEFVRMAAKFGATIVPFGAVGEDDLVELVLDYDDQIKIPVLNDVLQKVDEEGIRLRKEMDGEIANQFAHIPGILPKVPGRVYFLFGKPMQTKGMQVILKDKEKAKELYLKIKHEVESSISFLVKKREDDPYRSVVHRTLYRATSVSLDPIPTFDP